MQLARESMRQTACIFFEIAILWYWPRTRIQQLSLEIEYDIDIDIDSLLSKGSILAIVPHFGNWEFGTAAIAERYQSSALYDSRRLGKFERRILKSRTRFGISIYSTSIGGLRKFMRAAQHGDLMAILPDQVPTRGGSVVAKFMGQNVLTTTLVHKISRNLNLPVVILSCERVDGGFLFRFDSVSNEIRNADAILSATAMNAAIERVVSRNPAQYQWSYKRFRRVGHKDVYAEKR